MNKPVSISRIEYWGKLIDYYYDHIHFDEDPRPSIREWLSREFRADTTVTSRNIYFKNPADLTWFKLRWD